VIAELLAALLALGGNAGPGVGAAGGWGKISIEIDCSVGAGVSTAGGWGKIAMKFL
jgi:hypothetical protein